MEFSCCELGFAAESKPNVIVIISDDAGYADFSMQGSKNFPTPHIDSIAANGVRFTDGYVSAAVCSPSRAGIMTGRYQQRFGHEKNVLPGNPAQGLPVTEKTFADALKANGYRTMAIGKWHLGSAPKFHPLSRGFDEFYGFLSGSRHYFPGKENQVKRMMRDRAPVKETFNYTTDEFGRQAAGFIQRNKDKPFFLYLAFNAVHDPQEALHADLQAARGDRKRLSAMTIALDRAVGKVLGALKNQGIAENTLVFFVNDNGGPSLGGRQENGNNAPLRGFKSSMWDGGIRVPFAVQWPAKIPKRQTYRQPVIAIDIMPTALAAAGITPDAKLDGVNLLPFLTGPFLNGDDKSAPHEALFWRSGSRRAVRMGHWKLTDMGEGWKLFNLAHDIGERTDLTEKEPDKAKELQAAYAKWNAGNIPPKWQD